MKVLILNLSPRKNGCTARALKELEGSLREQGLETETMCISTQSVRGCIACGGCAEKGKCVFDDIVNEAAERFKSADGLVVGTPVYYAGANGSALSFLDRLFYSSKFDKSMKVGAAVISSRRAGSTSALDEIYKYYGIAAMPIATSTYWNEVHGRAPEQVELDLEGLMTMRNLGKSMAFLIKAICDAKEKYGSVELERGVTTSFCDGL